MPGECRASTSFFLAKSWMPAFAGMTKESSCHLDLAVFRRHGAVVVEPGEAEGAAFGHPRRELDVGVGRDRRLEVDAEHELVVERGGELVDDLARDELAALVLAKAGLHDVGDQRPDLDHLALLRALGQLDASVLRHRVFSAQPPQPPTVTLTVFFAVMNSPLLVLATTVTSCVAARRMRVATSARPQAGVKWNVTMRGRGLACATTRMSLM